MNDKIPVLMASDAAYLQHAGACVASLATNNPHLLFDVHLASAGELGDVGQKFARSVRCFNNATVTVCRTDLLPADLPLRLHSTKETYIRLWIGELFPKHDRALYLDPDVIVLSTIDELWSVDLSKKTVAAVPIPGSTRPGQLGMPPEVPYMQSGVLVFNLQRWRELQYTERCLEVLARDPSKAIDADQDILNICLQGDWEVMPYYWNVISPFYFLTHNLGISLVELRDIQREARIIHFNGASKPWSYLSRHPRRGEYWKYLRLTEWKDYEPADRSAVNWAKRTLGPFLPAGLKRPRRG